MELAGVVKVAAIVGVAHPRRQRLPIRSSTGPANYSIAPKIFLCPDSVCLGGTHAAT